MSAAALDAFVAALRAEPAAALIALDFDGTLAPLVADPTQSRLVPGVAEILGALGSAGARIALVTGRAPRTVLDLSGLGVVEGLEQLHVAGLYGLQVLDAATGEVATTVDDRTRAAVQAVRDELSALLADAPPGVHLEDKDIALVVHTRPAPDPQAALDQLLPAIRELAERHGLVHEPGRFAAEIRPGGSDKGATLLRLVDAGSISNAAFIWNAGFVPDARSTGSTGGTRVGGTRVGATRAVLYAGDDTGDLPALRAVPGLRDRGVAAVGVAVTQDGTDPDVPAAADLTVDGPVGLRDLLATLLP